MRLTLRTKIGMVFLLGAIVPFVVAAALMYIQVGRSIHAMRDDSMQVLASQVGLQVERTIFSAYANIKSLSENPVLQSADATLKQKLQEMQKMQDDYRVFEDITLIDTSGVVLESTTYRYSGEWVHKKWFLQAKAGERSVSPVHAVLYPYQFVIEVVAPIFDAGGQVVQVLAAQMNMGKIWDITDKVRLGETGIAFLTDQRGNILAYPDRNLLLCKLQPVSLRQVLIEGKLGMVKTISGQGNPVVVAYTTLQGYSGYKGQGWRIAIMQDRAEAHRVLRSMQLYIIVGAVGGILIILFLAQLLSRPLVRPLRKLLIAAQGVARGDFAIQVESHTRDEIGDLAGAFNGMVRDLHETTVSRDFVDAVFSSMQDAVIVTDIGAGNIKTINKAAEALLGYGEKDLIGQPMQQVCAASFKEHFNNLLASKDHALRNVETAMKQRNGTLVPVLVSSSLMFDSEGKPTSVVCSIKDITQLKKTEEMLLSEQERLAVTLRSIGDGVIAADQNGHVVLINGIAEKLTGYKEEEVIGKYICEVFSLVCGEGDESYQSIIKRVLEQKEVVTTSESCMETKNGVTRVVVTTSAPIHRHDSTILGLVLVFRDITQQKKLEEEMQRFKKLESLEVLAGGIAHDFNNILTTILGNISVAKRYAELSDNREQITSILADSEKASFRAKGLTQQLLAFSKGGVLVKETVSIVDLLKKSVRFVLSGSNVKSEFVVPDETWAVQIDVGQISQVINNLIINADQAMKGGGGIRIECSNLHVVPEHHIPVVPGKYVKITIQDEGEGISSDILPKIFDPFFTTKKRGSGLGLSISFSIVKKHGGYIAVESVMGKGTTFIVYLPASEEAPTEKVEAQVVLKKGKGKILVMDDEEGILSLVEKILLNFGYKVALAKDGEEVIAQYKQACADGEPFDAFIMDLTIRGGLGGKETIKKLLAIDPNVKAIVSSGYSTDPIMENYCDYGFSAVVAKPYDVQQLVSVLQNLLISSS